jgi:hypothetical protein
VLWVCRECGLEVEARDPVLVITIGWTGLDGDTGVCSPCKRRPPIALGKSARASAVRIEASTRAVATSRARVRQALQPRWDQALVEQAATRLGFAPEDCRACVADDAGGPTCPACEGAGEVYRRGDTTVSRWGLLKLSMWPT